MKRKIAATAATLGTLVIGLAIGAGAAGPSNSPHDASAPGRRAALPSLLVEVRGLRAAMEQMASAGPRVQLALGRVQLQEQRITTLIRRLDEARTGITVAQSTYDEMQRRGRGLQEDPGPNSPIPPNEFKAAQQDWQLQLASAKANLQRAGAEEAAMAADLASKQARWTDLNGRMEALEAVSVAAGALEERRVRPELAERTEEDPLRRRTAAHACQTATGNASGLIARPETAVIPDGIRTLVNRSPARSATICLSLRRLYDGLPAADCHIC